MARGNRKAGDSATAVQRLARTLKDEIAHAGVFSLIINLLYLAPTIFVLSVYSRVVSSRDVFTLSGLTAVTLLAIAGLAVLEYNRSVLIRDIGRRSDDYMVPALLNAASTTSRNGDDIANVFSSYIRARGELTSNVLRALFDAPWIPIYAIAITAIHPYFGILCGVSFILIFIANTYSPNPTGRVEPATWSHTLNIARNIPALRNAGLAHRLPDLEHSRRNRSDSERDGSHSAYYDILTTFVKLSTPTIAVSLGAWLFIRGDAAVGSMFAASLLASRAIHPFDHAVRSWRAISPMRSALAAIARITTVDEVRPQLSSDRLQDLHIHFDNVSLAAGGFRGTSVSGLHFDIGPGATTIVAGSCVKKIMLADAVSGLAIPSDGVIRYNGIPSPLLNPATIACAVVVLREQPVFLTGTIFENVSGFASDTEAARKDVRVALSLAGILDLVEHLPGGLNSTPAIAGGSLPMDFVWALDLARAIYRKPAVILVLTYELVSDARIRESFESVLFDNAAGIHSRIILSSSSIVSSHPNAYIEL